MPWNYHPCISQAFSLLPGSCCGRALFQEWRSCKVEDLGAPLIVQNMEGMAGLLTQDDNFKKEVDLPSLTFVVTRAYCCAAELCMWQTILFIPSLREHKVAFNAGARRSMSQTLGVTLNLCCSPWHLSPALVASLAWLMLQVVIGVCRTWLLFDVVIICRVHVPWEGVRQQRRSSLCKTCLYCTRSGDWE
jgi:hypothetical protein